MDREKKPVRPRDGSHVAEHEMTPAEERGERLDTGKAIARGGREAGFVPGAEPAKAARRRKKKTNPSEPGA